MNRNTNNHLDSKVVSYVKEADNVLRFDHAVSFIGPSPNVLEKLRTINLEELTNYPDSANSELKTRIAEFLGVSSNNITVGNGSDEIIENLPRILINPGDSVVIPVPTFFRFEDSCSKCGAKLVFVKMQDLNFTEEIKNQIIKEIGEKNPKLIWLCNPNNPTGKLIKKDFIEEIIQSAKNSLVIIDEACIDFVDEKNSSISFIRNNEFQNLIVLRTLSKAFGLASLRLGFAISSEKIIEILEKFRLPFAVNSLAQKLAITALNDRKHLERVRKITSEMKKKFTKKLSELDFTDSSTNFLLVRHKEIDLFENLLKQKILVADFRKCRGIENEGFVRITIKSDEENKILFSALEKILENSRGDNDG